MSKWCFDFEIGEFANIERDGFNIDRGEYTYNWDDSEYRREEEEEEERIFGIIDNEDNDINW